FHSDLVYLRENVKALKAILKIEGGSGRRRARESRYTNPRRLFRQWGATRVSPPLSIFHPAVTFAPADVVTMFHLTHSRGLRRKQISRSLRRQQQRSLLHRESSAGRVPAWPG